MKKLILLIALALSTVAVTNAQVTEARNVSDLQKALKQERFTYKGRGLIFGFNSIESCLYVSENFAVFENYCFPARPYPARGYTIFSREFGMIDLYREELPEVVKRDIRISEFPAFLAPYLTTRFPEASVGGLSDLMAKLYDQFNPACWSTNFDQYTERYAVGCTIPTDRIENFGAWESESQWIVNDENIYEDLMDSVERTIKQ